MHWARLELGVTSCLRGSKTIGIVRVKSENAAKRGTILGQFGGCVCVREDFPSLNWQAPLSSVPELSLAFYLQVGGGNTKARGEKINSCTAKVLNMKGPTLSFLLVPSVSFSCILFFL